MMPSYAKKIFGWALILIGLVIALTPFTPGSVLLLIGAEMVFGDWPEWQRFKLKIKEFLKNKRPAYLRRQA